MIYIVSILLVIVFSVLVCLQVMEIANLKSKLSISEARIQLLKNMNKEQFKLVEYWKQEAKLNLFGRNYEKVVYRDKHIDKDVAEAIKFAMIHSHPDKGNCKTNDEFIRFRKLYQENKGCSK